MKKTNPELLAAVFPNTKLAPGISPHDTMLSIAKARRLLGYAPRYSWRAQGIERCARRRPRRLH